MTGSFLLPCRGRTCAARRLSKRCVPSLAPSARGLRPQAVGERTVRLSEIFRAMARFSPSAPSGHLPRRGRFFNTLRAAHARPLSLRHLFVYNSFTSVTHYSRAAIRISIQKAAGTKSPQYPVENAAANCADCRLFCAPRAAYNSTSSKGCKCMRNWCSRHPVWFMALYALFYLSFFALLERTIQTPDL